MATIEERLALLEQEYVGLKNNNIELKRTIELQTIAISGLVNKTTLERLNQKYDGLTKSLISHDEFTNHQLAELREQNAQLDEKIVKLHIEVSKHFEQQESINHARFSSVDAQLGAVNTRLDAMDTRFDQVVTLLTSLINKPES